MLTSSLLRRPVVLLVLLSSALTSAVVSIDRASAAGPVTFSAAADARVMKAYPKRNYGTSSRLEADTSPQTESFVRFGVSGLPGAVTRARLRVYVTNKSANGPKVYLTGAGWSETGITWNTKPARVGAAVADAGALTVGAYLEYDVTAAVTGDGSYSFNLVPDSSDGADFNSKEAGGNRPQLVVETGGDTGGDPADTTSPDTTITSGPQGTVTDTAASFSFTATEPSAFQCSLDGAGFGACASPVTYSGLPAGSHTFSARAVDGAGNVDASPATRAWEVAPTPSPTTGARLVGAGDIAACTSTGDEATVKLLDGLVAADPAAGVFTTGDHVYPDGTASEFANCYDPTWGRYRDRTRPTPGNHDYNTAGASGYFGYFGARAGQAGKGWYSYDVGAWHVVVLNTNCSAVGGCGAGSAQEQWLRADLAASAARCTVAYFHHPRFSSGQYGNNSKMVPIWSALYDYGAELVLNGHEHLYERFAPQRPDGTYDPAFGIREFILGTGGKTAYTFTSVQANSEARNSGTAGVLELTLKSDGYDWRFHPVAGKSFTDSGSSGCHDKP